MLSQGREFAKEGVALSPQSDPLTRTRQSATHGGHGDAERVGRLLRFTVLDHAHHEDVAIALVQARKQLPEVPESLARERVSPFADGSEPKRLGLDVEVGAAAPMSKLVPEGSVGERDDERAERPRIAQAMNAPEEVFEHLLSDVFGAVAGPQLPTQNSHHERQKAPPGDERRVGVLGDERRREVFVGGSPQGYPVRLQKF